MLALVPEPSLGATIHETLRASGLSYSVPVRVTLQTGIDPRDGDWRDLVADVVARHAAYAVRLRGPDVIQDRTVLLRVVDQPTVLLRDDLHRALRAGGFVAVDDPVEDLTLALAGTWTDLSRNQVHELAGNLRDALGEPVEFRAEVVYGFDEAADDDLPRAEFKLA